MARALARRETQTRGRLQQRQETQFVEARLTILIPQKIVPQEVCDSCGKMAQCCIVVFEVMYEKTVKRKICGKCFSLFRKKFEEKAPINGLLPQSALASLWKTIEKNQ